MSFNVPFIELICREEGEFITRTTEELFDNKRVVVFSLPGAFTPTCSIYQLPGFEESYDTFVELGIDAIYCISVNDGFVMNAWANDQNIKKVKLIPDGNGDFTSAMGMLVSKRNLGFGSRSWRYAAVIENGFVEKVFEELGKRDDCDTDPYEESTPEKVLEYLRTIPVAPKQTKE